MMSVSRSISPAEQASNAARAVGKKYLLNLENCDAFEEILLMSQGIEEKPQGCLYGYYSAADVIIFSLVISKQSADQFIKSLNAKYSLIDTDEKDQLNAQDITYQVKGHAPTDLVGPRIPQKVNNKPAIIISMNATAIIKHLIPLFDNYLATHPELVWHYQRFSFTWDENVQETIYNLFASEGISIGTIPDLNIKGVDVFEETLCDVIKESYHRGNLLFNVLSKVIPPDLILLIGTFINAAPSKEPVDQLTPTRSIFGPSTNDEFATEFNLRIPSHTAGLFENYFWRLEKTDIQSQEKQVTVPNEKGNFSKFTLKNRLLLFRPVLDDIEEKFRSYPLSKLDDYRKKTGTIKYTTQECLNKLQQLCPPNSKLYSNIQSIINHISQHGFSEQTNDKLTAKLENISSKPFFSEPIFEILIELQRMMNKDFHLPIRAHL